VFWRTALVYNDEPTVPIADQPPSNHLIHMLITAGVPDRDQLLLLTQAVAESVQQVEKGTLGGELTPRAKNQCRTVRSL